MAGKRGLWYVAIKQRTGGVYWAWPRELLSYDNASKFRDELREHCFRATIRFYGHVEDPTQSRAKGGRR